MLTFLGIALYIFPVAGLGNPLAWFDPFTRVVKQHKAI